MSWHTCIEDRLPCEQCALETANPLYRMPARMRYQQDNEFHHLVDMLHAMIDRSQFSPSELREAATLASCMWEERQVRSQYIRARDAKRPT